MAGQPVIIVGTITGTDGKSAQVTIVGVGALTDPPVATPPIYYPPVFPAHPIAGPPPGVATPPIYYPPGIWGPGDPRPTHPIVIPEPPPVGRPPDGNKPPPPGGGWGYSPEYGWGYFPGGGGGKPQPLP